MEIQTSDFAATLLYCVGSTHFKELQRDSFIRAATRIDSPGFLQLLEWFHLNNLYHAALLQNEVDSPLLGPLQYHADYQKYFNGIIFRELTLLGQALSHLKRQPALLKGPAYWDRLYPDPYLRRVNDIDMLVEDSEDLARTCQALQDLGYSCVSDDYEAAIQARDHYELPGFIKRCRVKGDSALEKAFGYMLTQQADANVELPAIQQDPDGYSFAVIVEIHKAIYLFENDRFPSMPPECLTRSGVLQGFRVLIDSADLPYLAAKFVMDVDRGSLKCLKLMGDFVRLLERIQPDEIDASIEFAALWGAVEHYELMLHSAREVCPEIEMTGLKPKRGNPLRTLLNNGLTRWQDRQRNQAGA